MGTWNDLWPDGAVPVETNATTGTQNTTYIETTMNVDHFWNTSGTKDGHHQFVQMPQTGTPASPSEAALATGMDGAIYAKAKSSAEAPGNQDVQPFYIGNSKADDSGTDQVMQMLTMRTCCTFTGRNTNGVCTLVYNHNITSVTRTFAGVYEVVFPALPSANYLMLAGAVLGTGVANRIISASIPDAVSLNTVKSTARFTLHCNLTRFDLSTIQLVDPLQCWFVCFGG